MALKVADLQCYWFNDNHCYYCDVFFHRLGQRDVLSAQKEPFWGAQYSFHYTLRTTGISIIKIWSIATHYITSRYPLQTLRFAIMLCISQYPMNENAYVLAWDSLFLNLDARTRVAYFLHLYGIRFWSDSLQVKAWLFLVIAKVWCGFRISKYYKTLGSLNVLANCISWYVFVYSHQWILI